jgi:hypothetical protein
VYDMYYWDQPGQDALNGPKRPSRPVRGTRHPRRPVDGAHPGAAGATGLAARAVQVALDRRDNGGDSGAPRGK